ncbi:MAG: acyltransferase [Alphaproteobacteria bacterium]|nr:acyltransferase [Alphaproteobacteria bacterium]
MKRLHGLDALRGLAALIVVVWHWQHFFAVDGDFPDHWSRADQPFYLLLKPFYVQGWAAVDLFFVLSGFVFFWLYGEAVRERRIAGFEFARLRFSRLYPLHFALLLVVAGLQFLFWRMTGSFFVYQDNDWPHFVAHLFMVENWWPRSPQSFDGPAWSVSIEVMLYCLFFAASRLGMRRGWQMALVAAGGAALLFVDEHIGRGIIGFFMGGVAFTLWKRWRDGSLVLSRWLMAATIAGWIVLLALLYADSPLLANGEGNSGFLVVFDVLLCPLTVLAVALRESARGPSKLPLEYLGDISYATYLIHFPLQLALALLAQRLDLEWSFFMQAWAMPAFYIVLIALGTLSYRFFERPMQRRLRGR